MIYLVKVFNVYEGRDDGCVFDESVVAHCSDYSRANYILKNNELNIQDGFYNYGLIVGVEDGKVYSESYPIMLEVYKYDEDNDSFLIYNDRDLLSEVKEYYCFI